MDSGNSGSMSSSEGDDHDLDVASRPQSLSAFLTPSSSNANHNNNNNNNNNLNLFFQYQQNHPNSNPFELSTNYLHNALPQPQPPTSSNQTFIFNNQSSNLDPNSTTNSTRPNHQQQQQLPSSSSAHINKPSNLVGNSKKRTRASRRAPTTVLTTDTSNFPAMVQEFTGIPAPPFASASSSPYPRRLDSIFGTSSGSVYPLRPSAQKVHQYTPFLSSSNSSSSSLLMSNSVIGMVRASSSTSNTSHHDVNNFSFATQQGLIGNQLPHNHNIMGNMKNPSFNASPSSILHHQDQLPSFLSSSFGAKTNRDSGHSATLPLVSLEDQLGMSSHGFQNTNLDGSTVLPLRSDGDHDLRWRDHHGLELGFVSESRGVVDQNDQLRPSLGDQRLVNSSSSRSNTTRSIEAPVDSWVFSSD